MQPTRSQTRGLLFLVIIMALIIGYDCTAPGSTRFSLFDLIKQGDKYIAVELDGEVPARGIFFLPPGATTSDLLRSAGIIRKIPEIMGDLPLVPGHIYYYTPDGGLKSSGYIRSDKKFLLGMTINVNRASRNELMLIPGVGEKTAEGIIRLRQEKGGFTCLNELKEIGGIKEKRLNRIRGYLHVGEFEAEQV